MEEIICKFIISDNIHDNILALHLSKQNNINLNTFIRDKKRSETNAKKRDYYIMLDVRFCNHIKPCLKRVLLSSSHALAFDTMKSLSEDILYDILENSDDEDEIVNAIISIDNYGQRNLSTWLSVRYDRYKYGKHYSTLLRHGVLENFYDDGEDY